MSGYRGGFGGMGGFGGGFNMQQLMKQAQKMQEDMEKAKEELNSTEFVAKSGGGMVEVVMTGDKNLNRFQSNKKLLTQTMLKCFKTLLLLQLTMQQVKLKRLKRKTHLLFRG